MIAGPGSRYDFAPTTTRTIPPTIAIPLRIGGIGTVLCC